MRMRLLTTKLRVEIENEKRVFLESLAEVCPQQNTLMSLSLETK